MQVYKAVRHGVAEVAVKMVKCVVRLDLPEPDSTCRGHAAMAAVSPLRSSTLKLMSLFCELQIIPECLDAGNACPG